MSQTASQDPIDLIRTNDTGNDTTNAEFTPLPNPVSAHEETLATDTKRMPSSTPTPTQEDAPTSHQPQMVAHELSEDSSTQPRSSPPPVPSSTTDIPSEAPTDTQNIPGNEPTQVEQTQLPQPPEDLGSSKDPLETYDWAKFDERFHAEMEKCAKRESGIQEEFNKLLNVELSPLIPFIPTEIYFIKNSSNAKSHQLFTTWTTSASVHEENRAEKRLRTRSAHVQHREKTLEEKRTHYVKVVTAFENALALLSEA